MLPKTQYLSLILEGLFALWNNKVLLALATTHGTHLACLHQITVSSDLTKLRPDVTQYITDLTDTHVKPL